MPVSRGLHREEADNAAWEATYGAVSGAARWGVYSGIAGIAAYAYSPLYRGLTIQFKVYLQMSGMVIGSMLEADRRLRLYEAQVRFQKRQKIDRAMWEKYEQEFEEAPVATVATGNGGAAAGISKDAK